MLRRAGDAIARPVDSGIVELVETRVGIGIGGREVEAIEEPRGQLRLISLDRGLAGVVGDDRTVGLRLTGLQVPVIEPVERVVPDQPAIEKPAFLADLILHRGFGIERSEEHTSELQSLMRNSYAVFCY